MTLHLIVLVRQVLTTMSSPAKRQKFNNKSKGYFQKQARKNDRGALDVGDKGFLVTCNFKERDSIREVYHLLNTYYKQLNGGDVEDDKEKNDEELDVEDQLKKDIEKSKKETQEKAHLFNYVDTGVPNLIFIRTSIDDPNELGTAIIRDLFETKKKRTKVTLRFLPVQTVCKAKIEDIKDAGGLLFDKYFLKEPSTFAINFNKRYNNDIQRDEVIKELADLVHLKNPENKVNLKEPQQSIIVEIIKGFCLLTVVPDFLKMKKYNLNELWERKQQDESKKDDGDAETVKNDEKEEEKE